MGNVLVKQITALPNMLVVMTQSGQPSWEALAGVTNELEAHKKEKNSSEIPLKPQDTN